MYVKRFYCLGKQQATKVVPGFALNKYLFIGKLHFRTAYNTTSMSGFKNKQNAYIIYIPGFRNGGQMCRCIHSPLKK